MLTVWQWTVQLFDDGDPNSDPQTTKITTSVYGLYVFLVEHKVEKLMMSDSEGKLKLVRFEEADLDTVVSGSGGLVGARFNSLAEY